MWYLYCLAAKAWISLLHLLAFHNWRSFPGLFHLPSIWIGSFNSFLMMSFFLACQYFKKKHLYIIYLMMLIGDLSFSPYTHVFAAICLHHAFHMFVVVVVVFFLTLPHFGGHVYRHFLLYFFRLGCPAAHGDVTICGLGPRRVWWNLKQWMVDMDFFIMFSQARHVPRGG